MSRPFAFINISLGAVSAALVALAAQNPAQAPTSPGAGPVVVVETAKGTFEFETYPEDAPKTVAHIVALVEGQFYDGQRVHRVEPGFVVQFGDPKTRDVALRERWGRGPDDGSGTPIGVGEFSPKRVHERGSVAIAHPGDPRRGDSQMYITFSTVSRLDGRYTVFGQVIAGIDVVERLDVGDVIERVSLRRAVPAQTPTPKP